MVVVRPSILGPWARPLREHSALTSQDLDDSHDTRASDLARARISAGVCEEFGASGP
jgi:hypothetical protein